MSEATLTVREMRSRLVEKATSNPEFRAQLISDPKTAIKDELEMAIPPNFTIKVECKARAGGGGPTAPPATAGLPETACLREG